MDDSLGKRYGLVKRAETPWFSNHAMAKRLLFLKAACDCFNTRFNDDRPLLATTIGGDVIYLYAAAEFWTTSGSLQLASPKRR